MSNGMDIVVSDPDGKNETVYRYSNMNWRNRYACMTPGGLVVMWAPKEVNEGRYVITSGRRWILRKGKA